jgi:hypothetical protein
MVLTCPVRTGRTPQDGIIAGRSRREVLRAATLVGLTSGVTLVTGCDFPGGSKKPAAPDPLAPLIAEAVELATRHEAAVAAAPELAGLLGPIAQAHRAHAAELGRVAGAPVPSTAPSVAPAVPAGDRRATLAAIRAAQQQGRDTATKACLAAPEKRAALLGSIAAARATHLEVLK